MLIGPSGSGKSSLVPAGLRPRLRECGGWSIAPFRPGNNPFRSLAAALLPLYERELTVTAQAIETRRLNAALEDGTLALADIAELIGQAHPGTRPLLIADQFEELFTLRPDPEIHHRFQRWPHKSRAYAKTA